MISIANALIIVLACLIWRTASQQSVFWFNIETYRINHLFEWEVKKNINATISFGKKNHLFWKCFSLTLFPLIGSWPRIFFNSQYVQFRTWIAYMYCSCIIPHRIQSDTWNFKQLIFKPFISIKLRSFSATHGRALVRGKKWQFFSPK